MQDSLKSVQRERALLVGVHLSRTGGGSTDASLQELVLLAETAGAVVISQIFQRREQPHPATFIGKGKIEEIRGACRELKIDAVLFDHELSPVWQRNLERELGCKVVARTELILDIFAQHANTRDGKLQVELAQLRYRLPRLPGRGRMMSRLGGGIGTRGPGETQIEIDRRRISERIAKLKRVLIRVRSHRINQRKRRQRASIPVLAIVGYTNAGKSTLMNLLTQAGVLAENQLFATLDTTTRRLELEGGQPVLLTDTVGFIQNLPDSLITAFRATLEEVADADALILMVDISSNNCDNRIQAVMDVLDKLGAGKKPILTVFNKIDLLEDQAILHHKLKQFDPAIGISALLGLESEKLLQAIREVIQRNSRQFKLMLDYSQQALLQKIRENGIIYKEDFDSSGIVLEVQTPNWLYQKIQKLAQAYPGKIKLV